MSDSEKSKLLSVCFAYVDERAARAKEAMHHAQQSANMEEKSSAGDKYETGRAMAQIERDKAAQQLDEILKLRNVLHQIQSTQINTQHAVPGSLVITERNRFFIAISLGKINLEAREYFIISSNSPIGQSLLTRKVGDTFIFNNKSETIQQIL